MVLIDLNLIGRPNFVFETLDYTKSNIYTFALGHNRFSIALAGLIHRNVNVVCITHYTFATRVTLCSLYKDDLSEKLVHILSVLSSADIGERLCGAFHHLPATALQAYLLTLWKNLVHTASITYNGTVQTICFPWVMNYGIISDLICPVVSPGTTLSNIPTLQARPTPYSFGIDQSILSKISQLMPTMLETHKKTLLQALRRGFLLRLLLDSRDTPPGSCHNMIWMANHFVSTMISQNIWIL